MITIEVSNLIPADDPVTTIGMTWYGGLASTKAVKTLKTIKIVDILIFIPSLGFAVSGTVIGNQDDLPLFYAAADQNRRPSAEKGVPHKSKEGLSVGWE